MLYFYLNIIVLNLIAFVTRRRISWLEIYCSTFFALWIRLKVDAYLVYKLHLYTYFTTEGMIFWKSLLFPFIYGTTNYLIVNWFPYEEGKGQQIIYILSWTVWSAIIEFFAVKFHFIFYNDWNLLYSVLIYPMLVMMMVGNVKIIRMLKLVD